MNGQPSEEQSSSEPTLQHETSLVPPYQERFDDPMEGPRKYAKDFEDLINQSFPGDISAEVPVALLKKSPKTISSELDVYEQGWLTPYLAETEKKYNSIVTAEKATLSQWRELFFHKINQASMLPWHEVMGVPKPQKNRAKALHSAQIKLAIESTLLLSTTENFENIDLLDNKLNDIDAMIIVWQRSIDGEMMNEPQTYLPNPKMGREEQQAIFLKLEPARDGSYTKTDIELSDVIKPGHLPGSVAISTLNNLRINELSRRAEFKDKPTFHKLILAHRNAGIYTKQSQQNVANPDELPL